VTTTAFVLGCGTCSGIAAAIAVTEQMTAGQQWTVLALLAVVVVGIGGRITFQLDRLATANADLAKQTALLVQQLQNDRATSEETRQRQFTAVHNQIDRLPIDVANEVSQRRGWHNVPKGGQHREG
jgi:uncharacterized protein HemX